MIPLSSVSWHEQASMKEKRSKDLNVISPPCGSWLLFSLFRSRLSCCWWCVKLTSKFRLLPVWAEPQESASFHSPVRLPFTDFVQHIKGTIAAGHSVSVYSTPPILMARSTMQSMEAWRSAVQTSAKRKPTSISGHCSAVTYSNVTCWEKKKLKPRVSISIGTSHLPPGQPAGHSTLPTLQSYQSLMALSQREFEIQRWHLLQL